MMPPSLDIIATTFTNSLPSPSLDFDIIMSPLPEGQLTAGDRLRLQNELEQIKKITEESQLTYNDAHASIPAYQQLVLTTHAQVAKAKKAMQEAREAISTSSPSSSACSSSPTSSASSPPSPSSPLDNTMNQKALDGVERHLNLQRLEQEHADLGQKLSQALRDKAEAEETKKRLNDYIIQAKSRIKEIERKLSE